MADLPDINTADVGIIAFWNAEDHKTAGIVDPTDCTGVFTNYSVYDNGLDGNISLGSGRLFNCRVKNDGWCVAWIDRTNTFWYPTKAAADFGESGYKGYYDILWDWFLHQNNISGSLTTLSYIISLLEAALETSGNFTFSSGDVGHYCYEFTNASVLTVADNKHFYTGFQDKTGYIQYTLGTTLHYAAVVASNGSGTGVQFAGNTISLGGTYPAVTHGVADIIAENWMPSPLTDYPLYIYQSHHGVHGSVLIIWG